MRKNSKQLYGITTTSKKIENIKINPQNHSIMSNLSNGLRWLGLSHINM